MIVVFGVVSGWLSLNSVLCIFLFGCEYCVVMCLLDMVFSSGGGVGMFGLIFRNGIEVMVLMVDCMMLCVMVKKMLLLGLIFVIECVVSLWDVLG